MAILPKKKIRNLGIYGVIRQSEVDDALIPEGAVTEALNVHFDRRGAVSLRPGITALGATISAGYPCLGMHNAQSSTMLVAFSDGTNNDIYRYNGAAWAKSLEDDTKDNKTRFVDFAGRTLRFNGVDGSVRVWDGNTTAAATCWGNTGNPINPQQLWKEDVNPIRPKYGEVYKSRVYLAGDPTNPDRLYYSSVISSSGNITWAVADDWVDLNPDDGEHISGLKRYALELMVFKPNYIYRFRTSSVDPDPLIKLGTRSNESIVEGKKGLYFHHDSGIFRYSGGYPQEISKPIADIINAIAYSSYENIAGWKDDDHVYWSIGDITIEGETWSNVVIRYTESSDIWTVYNHSNLIRIGADYNSGSALTRLAGLDNGLIATYNDGILDIEDPISYRVITKWYEWDIVLKKTIQQLLTIAEKAQAGILMYQIDDKIEWYEISKDSAQIKRFITNFEPLEINFHKIRFKLTGISRQEAFIFLGIEVNKALAKDELIKEK